MYIGKHLPCFGMTFFRFERNQNEYHLLRWIALHSQAYSRRLPKSISERIGDDFILRFFLDGYTALIYFLYMQIGKLPIWNFNCVIQQTARDTKWDSNSNDWSERIEPFQRFINDTRAKLHTYKCAYSSQCTYYRSLHVFPCILKLWDLGHAVFSILYWFDNMCNAPIW